MAYERNSGLALLKKVVDSTKKVLDNLVVIYEDDRKSFLASIFERRADMVDKLVIYHQKSIMIVVGSYDMKLAILGLESSHIRRS